MDEESVKQYSPLILGSLYWLLNQFFSNKEKRMDDFDKQVEKLKDKVDQHAVDISEIKGKLYK